MTLGRLRIPWVIFRVYAKLCGYKIWKQSSQFVLKNNLKTSQIILYPRKDLAEMVSVCVSPIIPQGLVLVDMKWASDWKEAVQTMSNESNNDFVQIHVL